jgi:hypothetical protein
MGSFGATIPVTTLNLGFPGTISRIGKRTVTSRQVNIASANGPNFGDPCVIVANESGGGDTIYSVADYITASKVFNPALFSGIAMREVKTNLNFANYENIGTGITGSYQPGEMMDLVEEASITVKINVGTPASQQPVYIRTVGNGAITAGIVGGFEAGIPASSDIVSTTATTTAGSANITVTSATGLVVGMQAALNGVPSNSAITVISGTTVTLNNEATLTQGTAVSAVFSNVAQLEGVIFRTGVMDGNNISEITLKNRVAA